MAVDIRLRVGDTNTQDISLTSNGVNTTDFPIQAPEVKQTAIENLGDGDGIGVPSWSNVTESYLLHISDSTPALVADKVRAVERLVDLARQGSMGQFDSRVYMRLQFDHDSEAWRSQILAARLELLEGTDQVWRNYVAATLIITRRFYWETESLKDVAVTSGPTSTPTTSYATVYNADDTHATNRNWWQIAAAQVIGSLPAPAKISIKNMSGGSRQAGTFFLGNYVFAAPDTIDPIFRGEDATGSDTTPGTTEQNVYYWSLASNPILNAFRGQFGRFVVAWSDRPAVTTLVRAAMQYRGPVPEADLALGQQMLINPNEFVSDLGALPLPPSGFVAGQGANLYLNVKAKAATGTDTLGIDWLQIFPTGTGRYRVIKSVFALTLDNNNEMVDDGTIGATYLLTSGGEVLPLYRPLFTPIYLWPNRLQRLRMIVSGGLSSFEPGQQWGVKVQYRPRRLSF